VAFAVDQDFVAQGFRVTPGQSDRNFGDWYGAPRGSGAPYAGAGPLWPEQHVRAWRIWFWRSPRSRPYLGSGPGLMLGEVGGCLRVGEAPKTIEAW